jgi:hypothetical protein
MDATCCGPACLAFMRLATLAFAVLTAVPSLALAGDEPLPSQAAVVANDDCSRARALGKQCVLTIGAEEVEGGVLRPEGSVIDPRLIAQFGSLIRLRLDFIPEILRSADEVP